jgi:hypothetical protein
MSFSTNMAGIVADQLSRFITLNRHQLAGQAANLDFWLAQVRHALAALDGYGVRFIQMHSAQEQYVAAHDVTTSEFGPAGPKERQPSPPRRIPDRELQKARRALVEAARRFLDRCRADGLITEKQLSAAFADLDVEPRHA